MLGNGVPPVWFEASLEKEDVQTDHHANRRKTLNSHGHVPTHPPEPNSRSPGLWSSELGESGVFQAKRPTDVEYIEEPLEP